MKFRLATAQYDISFLHNWEDYTTKIHRWVNEARAHNAKLLLFPEYFSMELASLFAPAVYQDLGRQLVALQSLHDAFLQLFSGLAQQQGVTIVAGTFPVRQEDGRYTNRAWLFRPDGSRAFQDKQKMTRFEQEHWHISPGRELQALDSDVGKLGICTCYDSEFPLLARELVRQGANLILVPSCTDGLAGYNRVRIGCQARALENQCYVAQAALVGEAAWSEAVDVNVGAAAVYTPVDYGYPVDGILSIGTLNQPQWVYADLDLAGLQQVREHGQVRNYRDWSDYPLPN